MELAQWRKEPDLAGLTDEQIVDVVHQTYYADLPREKVAASLGVKPPAKEQDGPLTRGWKAVKSSVGLSADLAAGDVDAAAANIAEQARYAKANPGSEASQGLQKAWQEGDGIIGGIKAVGGEIAKDFRESPDALSGARSVYENVKAMGSGIVAQVPNMVLPMAGMIGGGAAGSLAGPVGTVAGGFAGAATGNTLVGMSEATQRQLQLAGINPEDTEAVKAYLKGNSASIVSEAAVKGAVIGAVDTATAGAAHFLLTGPGKQATSRALGKLGVDLADKAAVKAAVQTPEFATLVGRDAAYQATRTGTQAVARNAGAAGLDPAGEFVGEYLGSLAATGDADAKDAFLEAVSSLGQSAIMFGGQKLYAGVTAPRATVEDILAANTVDEAIATAQAAVNQPTPPTGPTGPLGPSLTGTDPAALVQRPDNFMDAVREPTSATGATASNLFSSQPTDPIQGPAREQAVAREDQRQDDLAGQAVARMREDVDRQAQDMREWPASTSRQIELPELDSVIQPGDIIQKSGAPWPAAGARLKLKAMKGQGTLIEVNGGFIVRPVTAPAQPIAAPTPIQSEATAAPAPVQSEPAPAPIEPARSAETGGEAGAAQLLAPGVAGQAAAEVGQAQEPSPPPAQVEQVAPIEPGPAPLTSQAPAAAQPEIVSVRDVYGSLHRVSKAQLDAAAPAKLRRYGPDGQPLKGNLAFLARENIDLDGSKRAEVIKDMPIIARPGDLPYKTMAALKLAMKIKGATEQTHDIKQGNGGFFAVLRRADAAAPQAEIPQPPAAAQSAAPDQAESAESLREQLRKVEAQMMEKAPRKLTAGGGDIEAIARSPVVPKALKDKRNAIKKQLLMMLAREQRETITPSEDENIGVNDAGEPIYRRKDGSIYRMHYGRPDFGGDLVSTAQANAAPEQAPEVSTHKDPGEPPEAATAPVIAESPKKAATREDRTPGQMRAELLAQTDPAALIPAPDGSIDFGEITPEMGKAMRRQAGKIRLQQGIQNANGTGYGLVHIEANHGKQIRAAGYKSVPEFVKAVAGGFSEVWQASGIQLLVTVNNRRKDVMFVQLEISENGDFYRVNSAFPVRQKDYETRNKMKMLWSGSEPRTQATGQPAAFAAGNSELSSEADPNAITQSAPIVGQTDQEVTPSETAQKPKAPKPNEDAGAELTYNKRNRVKSGIKWADLADKNDALKIKEATKQNVYPRPDYQALVDDGMQPMVAHLVKQVYDSIPPKPTTRAMPTDTDLKTYIEAVNRVMAGTMAWANDKDSLAQWAQRQARGAAAMLGKPTEISSLTPGGLAGAAQSLLDKVYPEGWRHYEAEVRILGGNKVLGALQPGYTEASRAVKAVASGFPAAQEAWQKRGYKIVAGKDMTADFYEAPGTAVLSPRVVVYLRVKGPDRTISILQRTFDGVTSKDDPAVQEWVKLEQDGYAERFVVLNKSNRVEGWGLSQEDAETLARELVKREGKNGPDESGTSVDAAEREGAARRLPGENITSERLRADFGFKGVNFGNWMKGDTKALNAERQAHLNHAYDSFMDLADILGVPPKAISLNGMLGMAFGAQGNGKFAAHFVPGVNEINLTRNSGAGSLAHEFGHALDHYFATQAGIAKRTEPFLTEHTAAPLVELKSELVNGRQRLVEVPIEGAMLRPEILARFKAIVQAMNKKPETPQMFAARMQEQKDRYAKNVEGWLKAIKGEFMTAKVDEPKFDELAEKVRTLQLGEGSVAVGPTFYVSPVVDQMRALYKRATGRTYSLDQTRGLQSNIKALQYASEALAEDKDHVPQQVGTDYAAAAARLDKDKGGKKYWSTNLEKFARAFDAFVTDTLAEKAAKNSYLSHSERSGETVPLGDERTQINAAIKALVDEIQTKESEDGNVAMFSKSESEDFAGSMDPATVESIVTRLTGAWMRKPQIEVIDSIGEAPPSVIRAYLAQKSKGSAGVVRGVHMNGTVYIVADAMQSADDVREVLYHEALGHFGLRGIFGESLRPILEEVIRSRRVVVATKASAYGLDMAVEEDRLAAAEEVLAELAQTRPELTIVQRAIAAIRTWLREHIPGFGNMALTDAEIVNSYILPARGFVERGRSGKPTFNMGVELAQAMRTDQTESASFKAWYGDWQNVDHGNSKAVEGTAGVAGQSPRGSTVDSGRSGPIDSQGRPARLYHGTADNITSFEVGHRNAKDHGWLGRGIYLTDSPDLADSYANLKGGDADPNVMPVYAAIKNPFEATLADKKRIRDGGQAAAEQFTAKLKAEGYDGVVLTYDDGIREFVAFEPTQIKSAVGNNGNFDPANPDIRFSLGGTAPEYLKAAHAAVADSITAPGTISWWDKTIGTPYHLAQRFPSFKRVFDRVQDFLGDVSAFATEAADMAPRILPKLETWKDIAKTALSATDTKAVGRPVWEGTLLWSRGEDGKPVKMEDLEREADALSARAKSDEMLRRGLIRENVLKMWQGLPVEQYEAAINTRYAGTVLRPGIVWSDAELKSMFGLNADQISLYREFRAATDKSISNLALSDMLRFVGDDATEFRPKVMEAPNLEVASNMLRDHLLELAELDPDRADVLTNTADKVIAKADQARDLMQRGYAPLMRFGQYTVDVVDEDGQRVYFGLFETKFEAARMAKRMQDEYPKAVIRRGTVSQEEYKLFAGVSPETLELFGEMLGLESTGDAAKDKAFQEYLKLAKSNRSAMRRLIHRKGTAGFSEDVGRVLAGFVYSNARQSASNLHMGEITQAANDIPQGEGQLKDAAVKLADYVKNPQEEAQAVRGLLFAQYLGGSLAAAMVNMTQPVQVTMPYLSQFGGIKQAAGQMRQAVADVWKKTTGDADLDAALKHAVEQGIVAPQEVHQLMAQAAGRGSLKAGDGTRMGDLAARANNTGARIALAWGKFFSSAELFNRRVTFIAAYRIAKAQKMADPAGFAEKAINDTQFVYNKGCVDENTECLTATGWKRHSALKVGESVYAVDPKTGALVQSTLQDVHRYEDGPYEAIDYRNQNGLSMVLTPEHKCLVQAYSSRDQKHQALRLVRADGVKGHHHFLRAPLADATWREAVYSDDEVRLFAWVAAEGCLVRHRNTKSKRGVTLSQSQKHNPHYVAEIDAMLVRLGGHSTRHLARNGEIVMWSLRKALWSRIHEALPGKMIGFDLVGKLTVDQMSIFLETFAKGDGHLPDEGGASITQKDIGNLNALQAMAVLSGRSSTMYARMGKHNFGLLYVAKNSKRAHRKAMEAIPVKLDMVWCPQTEHGTWIARRNGRTFVTGNSRPVWARGAIGSTLFTFKTYSVSYVELMHRMYTRGGPEGRKAALFGMAMLMLMGGASGLPFVEDVSDVVDGIGQRMGYNFSLKRARQQLLRDVLGKELGEFMDKGVSGLPGVPLDVSGRLGMGNLIPGTGIFTKKTDHTRDVLELLGPAADMGARVAQSADLITQGKMGKAVVTVSPTATRNLAQAWDMATTGQYKDKDGRKVIETTGMDAAMKAIGFQPNDVAKVQEASRDAQSLVAVARIRESEIVSDWATAIVEGDVQGQKAAREAVRQWNEDNKDTPIKIKLGQVLKKVQNMRMSKAQRIEKSAPKEVRAAARRELEQAN